MITIKNDLQLAKMRSAGHLLYDVLCQLRERMAPGMTTLDLDRYAHELITHAHATPSFLGYEGYPATLCVSIDDEVVHGIPSKHIEMKEGSIVSVDCGLVLDGWQADSAFTKGMGQISPECAQLIEVTERSFFEGARQAVDGNRLGDIGHAVQQLAESYNYGVIRDLTGHGIGREMHEDPAVPNYGTPGHGVRLRRGMTIAIEPMICQYDCKIKQLSDGWTVKTKDGGLAAHFEHSNAILKDRTEIMTRFWDDPDFDPETFSLK